MLDILFMRILLFFNIILLLFSCSSNTKRGHTVNQDVVTDSAIHKPVDTVGEEFVFPASHQWKNGYTYIYESDSLLAILNIRFDVDDTIFFDLLYKSKANLIQHSGLAIFKKFPFDGESISGNDGELFFVNEYYTNYMDRPLVLSIEQDFRVAAVSIHDVEGAKNDIFNGNVIMYLKK